MTELPDAVVAFTSISFELVFYIALLIFSFYTLFLAYHWFAYGTNRTVSMLSLAVFLFGGASLFLVMAITL